MYQKKNQENRNYRVMSHFQNVDKNIIDNFFQSVDELNNKLIKKYLSEISIYSKNTIGNNILHHIIQNVTNNTEDLIIEKIKLIDNIKVIYNDVDKKGRTSLHLICKKQYYNVYKFLITIGTFNYNIKDKMGKLCCHYVCIGNDNVITNITEKDKDYFKMLDSKIKQYISTIDLKVVLYKEKSELFKKDLYKSSSHNINQLDINNFKNYPIHLLLNYLYRTTTIYTVDINNNRHKLNLNIQLVNDILSNSLTYILDNNNLSCFDYLLLNNIKVDNIKYNIKDTYFRVKNEEIKTDTDFLLDNLNFSIKDFAKINDILINNDFYNDETTVIKSLSGINKIELESIKYYTDVSNIIMNLNIYEKFIIDISYKLLLVNTDNNIECLYLNKQYIESVCNKYFFYCLIYSVLSKDTDDVNIINNDEFNIYIKHRLINRLYDKMNLQRKIIINENVNIYTNYKLINFIKTNRLLLTKNEIRIINNIISIINNDPIDIFSIIVDWQFYFNLNNIINFNNTDNVSLIDEGIKQDNKVLTTLFIICLKEYFRNDNITVLLINNLLSDTNIIETSEENIILKYIDHIKLINTKFLKTSNTSDTSIISTHIKTINNSLNVYTNQTISKIQYIMVNNDEENRKSVSILLLYSFYIKMFDETKTYDVINKIINISQNMNNIIFQFLLYCLMFYKNDELFIKICNYFNSNIINILNENAISGSDKFYFLNITGIISTNIKNKLEKDDIIQFLYDECIIVKSIYFPKIINIKYFKYSKYLLADINLSTIILYIQNEYFNNKIRIKELTNELFINSNYYHQNSIIYSTVLNQYIYRLCQESKNTVTNELQNVIELFKKYKLQNFNYDNIDKLYIDYSEYQITDYNINNNVSNQIFYLNNIYNICNKQSKNEQINFFKKMYESTDNVISKYFMKLLDENDINEKIIILKDMLSITANKIVNNQILYIVGSFNNSYFDENVNINEINDKYINDLQIYYNKYLNTYNIKIDINLKDLKNNAPETMDEITNEQITDLINDIYDSNIIKYKNIINQISKIIINNINKKYLNDIIKK